MTARLGYRTFFGTFARPDGSGPVFRISCEAKCIADARVKLRRMAKDRDILAVCFYGPKRGTVAK